jgi:hypothetical protein
MKQFTILVVLTAVTGVSVSLCGSLYTSAEAALAPERARRTERTDTISAVDLAAAGKTRSKTDAAALELERSASTVQREPAPAVAGRSRPTSRSTTKAPITAPPVAPKEKAPVAEKDEPKMVGPDGVIIKRFGKR